MNWRERKHEDTYDDAEVDARCKKSCPSGIWRKAGFGENIKPVAGKGR